MQQTIVFASWNEKKAQELTRMAPKGIEILCLSQIPEAIGVPQADENGITFLENARIKAFYWAEKLKRTVLAEDSGICIDALNGYPGVFTKRCVQDLNLDANIDVDNPAQIYPELLKRMEHSGNKSTGAHWITAMCCVMPKSKCNVAFFSSQTLDGDMCKCAGDRVFGFDQYFKPVGSTQTLSEMTPEEKEAISPRKKAFEAILGEI